VAEEYSEGSNAWSQRSVYSRAHASRVPGMKIPPARISNVRGAQPFQLQRPSPLFLFLSFPLLSHGTVRRKPNSQSHIQSDTQVGQLLWARGEDSHGMFDV